MPDEIAPAAHPAIAADALLDAIACGRTKDLAGMLAALRAAPWPISPAACLLAAVKLRQAPVVAQLLAAGAPPQFLAAELPAADLAALSAAGISADGLGAWSPLVIAVRQHSHLITRMLLLRGASAHLPAGGLPLLLHFYHARDAVPSEPPWHGDPGRAGSGSSSRSSASIVSELGRSRGAGLQLHPALAQLLSPAQQRLLARIEARLQLLWLLLRFRADPLQQALEPPHHCFLTGKKCHSLLPLGAAAVPMRRHARCSPPPMPSYPPPPPAECQDPVMLRLAVNFVRFQAQRGRQLSDKEAAQLVAAAGRAYFAGF